MLLPLESFPADTRRWSDVENKLIYRRDVEQRNYDVETTLIIRRRLRDLDSTSKQRQFSTKKKNSYIIPDGANGESIMGVLNIIAGESLVTYILSGKKFKFVPHHLLKSVH